jgi:hypothetical protein
VGRYDHAQACRSIRALRQNIPEADINRISDIAQPEINFSWRWENEMSDGARSNGFSVAQAKQPGK